MSNKYLCIHGHFYQPPRENPWTGKMDPQPSAEPYPDWNERIYHECYLPNTEARILNEKEEVESRVNNFERMSFNLGPTLLSWLEAEHPETYQKIIEADKKSVQERGGHGNAIAQGYNHIILPLASERDKETQVLWGLYDFKVRFGRDAQAMWLPETACDQKTIEVLIKHQLKYVILAPHQALRIRKINAEDKDWVDVSNEKVDPRKPYRIFSKEDPNKFIDAFFYDGPISKGVSFDDILVNAHYFCKRIDMALGEDTGEKKIVHIATDGETYGHHKVHGEMGLAYLLFKEAEQHGYVVTNYGECLSHLEPIEEVELNEGEDGLGTSWSCSHGVQRWFEDCGCQTGAGEGWNQKWRRPLRESLDWLRDLLVLFCERHAEDLFKDFWQARNDYIQLILDFSDKSTHDFFKKHAKKELSTEEEKLALKLLKIQEQAMLMYTSCGWFFSEISGIETVQILKYAARAMELAEEIEKSERETLFMDRLAFAKSNLEEYGDGKQIYQQLVKRM